MDTQHRTLLKVGLLANTFEWYEFSVFGFLAGLMGQLFFESSHPITGLIRGFMLFTMSYIARPLGSLVFGVWSGRIGYGRVLRLSLMLMSVPTILIGLLPTYEQIGITATLCLTLFRVVQGFAAGGELPSSGCYVFETAKPQYRSLLCSAVTASATIGMLLGSLTTVVLTRLFDHTVLLDWAWRIPFLLGIPITLFIAYIRQSIATFSIEKKVMASKGLPNQQWFSLGKSFVKAFSLVSFESVCFYMFFIWMPAYLSYFLNVPSNLSFFITTLMLCAALPLYLLGGVLCSTLGLSLSYHLGHCRHFMPVSLGI